MSLGPHPLVGHWLGAEGDVLVVRTGKVDIGQRISTALMQIAHEELTQPLECIRVAPVATGECPDEGITSGSNSVEQSGRAVRLAAATLRRMATAEAARRLGGEPPDWRLEDGALTGPGSNRPVPLTGLIADMDLGVPVDLDAPLAGPRARPARPPMAGLRDIVTGRYRFVHDLDAPGMLHARVVRPPNARARLAGVDAAVAARLRAEGLRIVRDGSFLAVAGAREWDVVKAAGRLFAGCAWQGGGLPEDDVFARLTPANAERLIVEDGTPRAAPVPPAPDAPAHAARYERPFTMHAALAPSAALATWDGARLDIVTHSQGIYPLRQSIADSLGLDPRAVCLTHAPGSGCYGHNGADDAAFEAALLAMALPGAPVLLKWSREDEHAWEPYGTAMAVELAAATGPAGEITAYSAEAIAGTFRGRPRPGKGRAGPAKLLANRFRADPVGPARPEPNLNRQGGMHRNLDPVYRLPEVRLVKNLVADLPHRTSALRCLGAAANVFALESFMDELAAIAGRDALDYRRAHLGDARALAVLDRLGAALGAAPSGAMAGRGVAYAQYKNAMARVGVGVDLHVTDLSEVRLDRAVIVADAGRVIDLGGLEAQLEGGFLQGASWALCEAVTWDRDGITSRDWDSYPVLRFDNVPEIEVIVLDRPGDASVGAGEAAPGPALGAIANAVCAATGLRLRRLPFTPDAISRAALRA